MLQSCILQVNRMIDKETMGTADKRGRDGSECIWPLDDDLNLVCVFLCVCAPPIWRTNENWKCKLGFDEKKLRALKLPGLPPMELFAYVLLLFLPLALYSALILSSDPFLSFFSLCASFYLLPSSLLTLFYLCVVYFKQNKNIHSRHEQLSKKIVPGEKCTN